MKNFLRAHREKIIPGILCIFLGYCGAHRFYTGRWKTGLIMLYIAMYFPLTSVYIWAALDFVLILFGKFQKKIKECEES